jgi:hypothetical protein
LSLHAFKARKVDKMMTEVQKKIELATTPEDQFFLQKSYVELKKKSVHINREMGRIVPR